jgi:hypothetical protein
MSDAINSALNRSKNHEIFLGAAVQYLGKARREDAEVLAELMTAQIELIAGSAEVVIPLKDGVPVLSDQERAAAIVHIAAIAMSTVFVATLKAAARALGNEDG